MSMEDYVVDNDKFDPGAEGLISFPCSVCIHIGAGDKDYPCRTCGHNVNADDPEDEPQDVCDWCESAMSKTCT
jgi:hypothetical protein